MPEPGFKYFYYNGHWLKHDRLNTSLFSEGITIYEVIRVIDGIPLFIEAHLMRLALSAQLINSNQWPSSAEINQIIHSLIKMNKASTGNIQVLMNHTIDFRDKNFACRFIATHYPKKEAYEHGVKSMLFDAIRDNPQVKKNNQPLRDAADKVIKSNRVYEVILVDKQGFISEGSRSNVFFIKDSTMMTSPKNKVLLGVTRQKVIQLCKSNGIKIVEKSIKITELVNFDAAFFTGTSPKVLPIANIGQIKFNPSNPLLRNIIKLFDTEISHYISQAKTQIVSK